MDDLPDNERYLAVIRREPPGKKRLTPSKLAVITEERPARPPVQAPIGNEPEARPEGFVWKMGRDGFTWVLMPIKGNADG